MNLKWTKADEKRADKMGWELKCGDIWARGGRFTTSKEAAKWVVNSTVGTLYYKNPEAISESDWATCRKAILICCGA